MLNFYILGFLTALKYVIILSKAEGSPSTLTSTMILSLCTNKEPSPAAIPNLSFGKYQMSLGITYNDYPSLQPETCSHDTASSVMSFAEEYEVIGNNGELIGTSLGIISAGVFLNQNVTRTTTLSNPSYGACTNNPVGLEIIIVTVQLNIVNGPSCSMIIITDFCPGIHSTSNYTMFY